MKNPLVYAMTLAVLSGCLVSKGAAQELNETGSKENREAYTVNLAFSKDGRTLREIRMVSGPFWSIRAMNWDVPRGRMRHVIDPGPDTSYSSATSDGRFAVISDNLSLIHI